MMRSGCSGQCAVSVSGMSVLFLIIYVEIGSEVWMDGRPHHTTTAGQTGMKWRDDRKTERDRCTMIVCFVGKGLPISLLLRPSGGNMSLTDCVWRGFDWMVDLFKWLLTDRLGTTYRDLFG